MCEVVEISDDEGSFELEDDVGVVPKNEDVNYDLPPHNMSSAGEDVASSSGVDLRSYFIGMGFAPSLVNKAIEENGEGNAELLLETLFVYSDLQQPKSEASDDSILNGVNHDLAANFLAREASHKSESSDSLDSLLGGDTNNNAYCEPNFHVKMGGTISDEYSLVYRPWCPSTAFKMQYSRSQFAVEPSSGSGVSDEKTSSLLRMNFSSDEVRLAVDRHGKRASIDQLKGFIIAARMAKKYERDTNNPFPGDEDCNNEALFGISEKTLRLLEMGFSENEISDAFDRCGSETPLPELANSIVAPGTEPNVYKPSSTWNNPSVQINSRPLKRKMGECLLNQPLSSVYVKSEECSSDVVSQVGSSILLEKTKGKMIEEKETYERCSNWKKLKEEFMEESINSEGQMWLEARSGMSTMTSNNRVEASRRRVMGSLEDTKPSISISNPCRSLSSFVAKPPYFLYGNVTNLTRDSWAKISHFLYSVQPEFVNSQSYSALSRREGYVHNLPIEDRFHIFPKGPMTIQEAIPHTRKWWPSWDDRKQLAIINCERSGVSLLCDRLGRVLVDSKGFPSIEQQRKILQQCEAKNLLWVGNCKLAPLEPEHLERIMGYPLHHSQVAGFGLPERLTLLKHSFQTDTLGYHLSVLRHLLPEGATVLSFYTGIGGAEVALHRLGIHLKGVVSVEPCETKRRILKKWWDNSGQSGELIQMESMNKLSSNKLEDLIKKFRGFDIVVCQNPNSAVNCDSLSGSDFSMFAEFVRVLQRVRSTRGTIR